MLRAQASIDHPFTRDYLCGLDWSSHQGLDHDFLGLDDRRRIGEPDRYSLKPLRTCYDLRKD